MWQWCFQHCWQQSKLLFLLFWVYFYASVLVVLPEASDSACASDIDALFLQWLTDWNDGKEFGKKHLVILMLYVITEAQDYVCSHSQSTWLCPVKPWYTNLYISRGPCSQPQFYSPGSGSFWDVPYCNQSIEILQDRLLNSFLKWI